MYVKSDYAERELPVLHDMIEAARFGLIVVCADGERASDDDRAIAEAMTDHP